MWETYPSPMNLHACVQQRRQQQQQQTHTVLCCFLLGGGAAPSFDHSHGCRRGWQWGEKRETLEWLSVDLFSDSQGLPGPQCAPKLQGLAALHTHTHTRTHGELAKKLMHAHTKHTNMYTNPCTDTQTLRFATQPNTHRHMERLSARSSSSLSPDECWEMCSEAETQVDAKQRRGTPRITSLCVALHPGSPCTSIRYYFSA